MEPDKLKLEQGRVLRQAREEAGFKSIASAIRASPKQEKWKPSTLSAHERGFRTIDQGDAERYASFYRERGARITGQEILYPAEINVTAKLAALEAQVKKLGEGARARRLAHHPQRDQPPAIPKAPTRGPKASK